MYMAGRREMYLLMECRDDKVNSSNSLLRGLKNIICVHQCFIVYYCLRTFTEKNCKKSFNWTGWVVYSTVNTNRYSHSSVRFSLYAVKTYVLRGLCGLLWRDGVSYHLWTVTTNGARAQFCRKLVPDCWSGNMETPLAKHKSRLIP